MRKLFLKSTAASAGLSALFLIVYSGCNWITARRVDVGTINFEWERHLPFLPWLIAPYLSIDLFFITAPFLCRSERELAAFAKRIATAILVAGICFLLFPFRFAYPRPTADGWMGAAFDWFRGMDLPFNLFPSLHIALCALLLPTYARRTRGIVRAAILCWFVLIAASAVFTYQHHVLDVVGGFALAGYCFYFFPETNEQIPVTANYRIGLYYTLGVTLVIGLIFLFSPWGALLIWVAVALSITAAAYFGFGPSIYRKRNGKLPWSTWWTLGPCLLGQYLSLLYYKRRCARWNEIVPGLWLGRVLSEREAEEAVRAGVTAVLDVTAEFSAAKAFRSVAYQNIPILDLTAPTFAQLEQMARFIREHIGDGTVYVHCKIGYSRSAAAVVAYLLTSGKVTTARAGIALLKQNRPSVIVRPEVRKALDQFANSLLPA